MKGILKYFGKPSKAKSPLEPPSPTSQAVAIRIKNILGIRSLESMPAQASRAFSLSSDPKAGVADFVALIEGDEALGARVIRIANSVYFSRGEAVTDIERAVVAIGMEELRCLLSSTMLQSLLKSRSKVREFIWANSVATAISARILSRSSGEIHESEAYLCGLLHDVGKLVMINKNAQSYENVYSLCSSGNKLLFDAEEQVFQVNHVEVGKWAAEKWNFPEKVIRSIMYHHRPYEDFDPQIEQLQKEEEFKSEMSINLTYPLIVKIADRLAHSMGMGHPKGYLGYRNKAMEERPLIAKILGLSTEDLEEICNQIEVRFEEEMSLYDNA